MQISEKTTLLGSSVNRGNPPFAKTLSLCSMDSRLCAFRLLLRCRLPLPHRDPNCEPRRERYCKQHDKDKLLPDQSYHRLIVGDHRGPEPRRTPLEHKEESRAATREAALPIP